MPSSPRAIAVSRAVTVTSRCVFNNASMGEDGTACATTQEVARQTATTVVPEAALLNLLISMCSPGANLGRRHVTSQTVGSWLILAIDNKPGNLCLEYAIVGCLSLCR